MASLAEKRKADAEERSEDAQVRPEELRLLEALLFASTEPSSVSAMRFSARLAMARSPSST